MAERRGGDVATPFMLCDDSGELYAPNLYPRVPAQLRDPHPVWYSPLRVLGLLSAVSFFIYIDRGVISSNGVQGDQSRGMQVRVALVPPHVSGYWVKTTLHARCSGVVMSFPTTFLPRRFLASSFVIT